MASSTVGSFAAPSIRRKIVTTAALEAFTSDADALRHCLPAGVSAMTPVTPSPEEWLYTESGDVCPCGTCGRPTPEQAAQAAAAKRAKLSAEERAAAADAFSFVAVVHGSSPYHLPIRARITAGAKYSSTYTPDDVVWPVVFIADAMNHIAVQGGNCIESDLFDLMEAATRERLQAEGVTNPSLLAVTMDMLVRMLRSEPVEEVEGSPAEAAWDRAAAHQSQRLQLRHAYTPLNPSLFPTSCGLDGGTVDWASVLAPELHAALVSLKAGDPSLLQAELREDLPGLVYSFPMFTPAFAETLLAEVEAYEASGMPVSRPNSMNNYGLILNQVGMEHWMSSFQLAVTQPIAAVLFPEEGEHLDDHHSFTVRYTAGEDLGLDMHTDDSDVTFNICLGKPGFTAAGLTFCGMMAKSDHRRFQLKYRHEIGRCVVHLGRQRHGADDIEEGCRVNLIMWNKSTAFRKRRAAAMPDEYEREGGPPSLECLSFTHDRDFEQYKLLPKGKEGGRGWCPPRGKEHLPMPKPQSAESSGSGSGGANGGGAGGGTGGG